MTSKSRIKPTLFTPEEANRMLPLVRSIVEDITNQHREMTDLSRQHRRMVHAGDNETARNIEKQLQWAGDELARLTDELHDLGCTLKHPEDGLVDFPAIMEGLPAFLCWKLGEERIGYWHPIEAGFAARKPIEKAKLEDGKARRNDPKKDA